MVDNYWYVSNLSKKNYAKFVLQAGEYNIPEKDFQSVLFDRITQKVMIAGKESPTANWPTVDKNEWGGSIGNYSVQVATYIAANRGLYSPSLDDIAYVTDSRNRFNVLGNAVKTKAEFLHWVKQMRGAGGYMNVTLSSSLDMGYIEFSSPTQSYRSIARVLPTGSLELISDGEMKKYEGIAHALLLTGWCTEPVKFII